MVEKQSYPFDLIRSPLFFDEFNVSFDKTDFDGTDNFQIVLSSICPDNISDCLNVDGTINGEVTNVANSDIALELVVDDERNRHILIKNDVSITLNEDIDVKGVFIRKKSNGFVVFAMVNENAMRFCEKIIFESGNIILQITG